MACRQRRALLLRSRPCNKRRRSEQHLHGNSHQKQVSEPKRLERMFRGTYLEVLRTSRDVAIHR